MLSTKLKKVIPIALGDDTLGTELITAIDTAIGATSIEDAITNGEVAKAPTSNAVFDALVLKAPLISPSFTTPTLGAGVFTTLNTCTFVKSGQATTNASGELSLTGMTANGVILILPAESITGGLAYTVAATDKVTVYNSSAAAIASKKMNYFVISY